MADFDLKIDDNGDLILAADGSFEVVTGNALLLQRVMFRLRTVLGDYLVDNTLGTTLEDYVGDSMSNDTLDEIETIVKNELNNVPSIRKYEVYVTTGVNQNQVLVIVELESIRSGNLETLAFVLDSAKQRVIVRQ